jgi:SAM-dependent methyltransferase
MSEEDRDRWNARYREASALNEPSSLITSLDALLPRHGRALDVAGGAGRHAIWLAQHGLEVTLTDVSDVALALARDRALAAGVALTTVEIDLERDSFPKGPWDLIVSFHYLQRSLFDVFPTALAPGGLLVFVQPTRSNLVRHTKPSASFLLDDGELPRLAHDLEHVHYDEGWLAEGRHEARIVARRNAPLGA